ncbi:ERMES complex subunit MDM12 [Sporobolomyces salmoneus]|uniref:ERMES complex subunit MDM12 n=1 Tax=Sporobolomyces salmoneus TaxID=183962 RepID=UPI0031729F73
MSIDLDWGSLDYHLTESVHSFLASAFSSAPRPNFIGPLSVDSFSFGDSEPTLELVDIRDVYKEFLQEPPPPADLVVDELSPPPIPPPLSRTRTRSRSPHPHGQHTYQSEGDPPHSFEPPSPTPSHLSFPHDPLHPNALPSVPISSAPSPSFQIHLHLTYSGTLSLGISTSLLINYPSPNFMSLPLSLTITSLSLEATLVVAFEGSNRSIHLSLLDPHPTTTTGNATRKESSGSRILKQAVVESEVGQTDKHVLKNVGKVEKFVLEVARKTLENEIVFPNFQTILF